jgi:hypothetical protein
MLSCLLVLATAGSTSISGIADDPVETVVTPDGGVSLMLEGCWLGWLPGLPDLPLMPACVPLENGRRAVSVDAVVEEWTEVEGVWPVRALPRPSIPSRDDGGRSAVPCADVFSADASWPGEAVELTGTGFREGSPVADLVVHPLRWNPVTGRLERLTRLEVSVTTAPSGRRGVTDGSRDAGERMIIITDQDIRAPMDTLAAWRTEAGLLTEVVDVSDVLTWPGVDDPERIRNYIIDRVAADGIDYVLLGGDTKYIPCRYAFALTYETGGGRDDSLPCDLYYADLDGSWNLDGDDVWGEVADSVDLYPDVLVGRAPVENLDEAWAFVDKIRAYETADITEHMHRALMIAMVMWEDPYTDGGVLCDYVVDNYVPGFYDVERQYESEGYYGSGLAVAALSSGTNYLDITAHGWIDGAGCLGISDVESVNSYGRFFGMAASDGCWTAAFDFDAVAEHFVTNPLGCGVSYIGNSSYGWGSPGNPLYGYSDRMTIELFKALFEDPSNSLGGVIADAKVSFVPFSREANTYRCLQYMVNLLGDPSMVTYRMGPIDPVIDLPDFVTPATGAIPVSVSVPGIDVEGACVCLHDETFDNYIVQELDASGHFIAELASPPDGEVTVTVTGTHIRRTTVTIPQGTGPSLVLSELSIEEPSGSGHLIPGGPASLHITLSNQGTTGLTGVELLAVLEDGPAEMVQASVQYGDMVQGSSGQGSGPVELTVDTDAATGDIVDLQLQMTSDQGSWSCDLPLLVYAPGLYFTTYQIDDTEGGNGNGYAEAGESFDLLMSIANIGLLDASDVWVSLQSQPSYISWTVNEYTIPWVGADSTGTAVFSGIVQPAAPEIDFPSVWYDISCDDLWYSLDSLVLVVGVAGISDDIEGGSPGWTHTGVNDMWHVSQSSSHSTSHSWYCGMEPGAGYLPSTDCGLMSPEVYLAPSAELTFWSRFDLALYGADGLYVLARASGSPDADTLDFIGAGGLLGDGPQPLNENLTWLPRTYDLSGMYPTGTPVRIELWFYSDDDADVGGGFWIDDITITGGCTGEMGGGGPGGPVDFQAGLPIPNPCHGSFSIEVLSPGAEWALTVFDLSGRIVHRAVFDEAFQTIQVDGLQPGVYLVRVDSDGEWTARRLVVVE